MMTPREKKWIVYDVGNSAFVLLSTAVVPIYANSLLKAAGETNIVSTWGYAQTIASLVIAVLMPLLGSIADVQGMKIRFFTGFFLTGVVTCCAMALPLGWLRSWSCTCWPTIGLNGSLTFYDSMLIDTTSNERMDKVSSHGYGWGYIGSTVPFIFCIALIFGGPSLFGWSTRGLHARLVHHHRHLVGGVHHPAAHQLPPGALPRHPRPGWARPCAARSAELGGHVPRHPQEQAVVDVHDRVLLLHRRRQHRDFHEYVVRCTQLGIDSTQLVVALLVTQFVAFPCSIIYGKLARPVRLENHDHRGRGGVHVHRLLRRVLPARRT